MTHTFRIVFMRSWEDDFEFAQGRCQKKPFLDLRQALIDQLRDEIDDNPAFKGRFVFSPHVLLAGGEYYILGEIQYDSGFPILEAWDAFCEEFQATYDEFGAAGHYRIVPLPGQEAFAARLLGDDQEWPLPPWK